MELKEDFETFLKGIRPTDNQNKDLQTGHKTLRDRLNADEDLKSIIVSDFLQGSYRRSTAIRPKGDKRSDVDIIVVTNLNEDDYTPKKALKLFEPFLNKHYKDKWRPQGRSFGIYLTYVELDLVITSAPSEADQRLLKSDSVVTSDYLEDTKDWRLNSSWIKLSDRYVRNDVSEVLAKSASEAEWKLSPLRIPDRNVDEWDDTHPLEQIQWTRDKNKETNGHFVNVIKALKWWRLEKHQEGAKPKSFPLERFLGDCCPDGISSIGEGITLTLEYIVTEYKEMVNRCEKPFLPDYGVPEHDVFAGLEVAEFKDFYNLVCDGAVKAREALDAGTKNESRKLWRELLGSKFPAPEGGSDGVKKGFTEPEKPASPGSGRFA